MQAGVRHRRGPRLRWIGLVTAVAALSASASASAATIKVRTDRDDFATGTSCSLRQAIQSANTDTAFGGCTSGSHADTIELKAGHRYIRELPGPDAEDNNVSGDFDIASKITITVKGSGKAELNGGGLDRVLQVLPGGALSASDLTLRDGDVAEHQPSSYSAGGAILAQGDLTLTHSKLTNNRARTASGCNCGGGIAAIGPAVVTLDNDKILDNNVENIGGAIAWLGGKLRVNHTTMAGNKADYAGGAVYFGADAGHNSAAIRNSTMSKNQSLTAADNAGGGAVIVADFANSKLSLSNSTITENKSNANGGGIWQYSGILKVDSSTIARNTADAGGGTSGGGGGVAGSVVITNSIVTSNHDLKPASTSADCLGASVSQSLVGKDTGCSGAPTNRVAKNPGLGQLASNGGPTKTLALHKSSPAVNHGSKSEPNTDQRGRRRDQKPDLGAYELIAKHHHR